MFHSAADRDIFNNHKFVKILIPVLYEALSLAVGLTQWIEGLERKL